MAPLLDTDAVLAWLLTGDAVVQYATRRDLLEEDRPDLRARIASEDDAAAILAARRPDGHWGRGFYQPKWTSTHYTLLELRGLGVAPTLPACRDAVALCLAERGGDGGVNPSGTIAHSDVCVNGMFLAIAAYFGAPGDALAGIVDFILGQQVADGGFNCRSNRDRGVRVGSVHTTASVIEGLTEYLRAGYGHRSDAVRAARADAVECLLARRLYQVRATGEPIHPEVVKLHHPARWHFDVLRGLDVLRDAGVAPDERLAPAVAVLRERRRPDGRWAANRGFAGETHVTYPRAGQPNRWVTLAALRVLRAYG